MGGRAEEYDGKYNYSIKFVYMKYEIFLKNF